MDPEDVVGVQMKRVEHTVPGPSTAQPVDDCGSDVRMVEVVAGEYAARSKFPLPNI